MILTLDIGNSNIVFGVYHKEKLLFTARVKTDVLRTEWEYAVLIRDILKLNSCHADSLTGSIISSVVPPLSAILSDAVSIVKSGIPVLQIGPGIKTGLNIKIDNPSQLGADMVATAVGAMTKYPLPAVIIDLGTATKITVVDCDRNYLGGSIMPGVMISLDALSNRAAQLPHISLTDEVTVIGTNTIDAMKSGVILGTAGMVDGMIERYREKVGKEASVVACGGLVGAIIPHCRANIITDHYLLLDGLRFLYEKNVPSAPVTD